MAKQYTVTGHLGNGTYGDVVLATAIATGRQYAIKRVPFNRLGPRILDEILNQKRLRHPHIIQFKHVYIDGHGLNIVMEYAQLGSLLGLVNQRIQTSGGPLPEHEARWYFQQLIIALDFCHRKQVGHRDLKLDNILLAPNPVSNIYHHLKLADFGFTANEVTTVAKSVVGTYCYMAPDVLTAAQHPYSPAKADVWSCGIILYTMLTATNVFPVQGLPENAGQAQTWQHLFQHHLPALMNGCPAIPPGVNISPECHALLKQLLNPNPAERITVQGILAYPWFRADLDAGVLTMNQGLLVAQPAATAGVQSDEEITAVVQQALVAGAGGAAH